MVLVCVRYPDNAGKVLVPVADVPRLAWIAAGRGLHSSTFRLKVSTFLGICWVHEFPPIY